MSFVAYLRLGTGRSAWWGWGYIYGMLWGSPFKLRDDALLSSWDTERFVKCLEGVESAKECPLFHVLRVEASCLSGAQRTNLILFIHVYMFYSPWNNPLYICIASFIWRGLIVFPIR
jgi:hypothetical protein